MQLITLNQFEHPLHGYWHGQSKEVVVVAVHGFKGFCDWGFFPWLSDSLINQDRSVFRFNFSHNGVEGHSDEFTRLDLFAHNTFSREIKEIIQVCQWLKNDQDVKKIVLMGHSRGAGVSVLASPFIELAGVITLAGIDSVYRFDQQTVDAWKKDRVIHILNGRTGQQMPMDIEILEEIENDPERFDILKHAQKITCPCLHLHSVDDETVVHDAAQRLSQATSGQLVMLPSGGHAFGSIHPFAGETKELKDVICHSTEFLDQLSQR